MERSGQVQHGASLASSGDDVGSVSAPQGSRNIGSREYLRLLLYQFRDNAAEIQEWLVNDARQRESNKASAAAVLNDTRRQFDSADDLIHHLFNMTKDEPTWLMRDAMFRAVNLFCADYLNQEKAKQNITI